MSTHTLIASDRDEMSLRIRDILARNALECPAGHVVPIDSAADRAARVVPSLIFVALQSDAGANIIAIRELRRAAPQAYIAVIGPGSDMVAIQRILEEGMDEYLDHMILETEMNEAIARFKVRAAPQAVKEEAGWVIAVVAPSGGSGSSIAAANISITLAQAHGPCGLIDMRLSAGDLASMLDLRPNHSLADVCDEVARLDRGMLEHFFVQHSSGVCLLAAPSNFTDIRRVNAKGIRQAFVMARAMFPYVVTDLDNVFANEQMEALWQADVIVMMFRLDYTSVRNTRRSLDHLAHLGVDVARVRLVANSFGERKQLSLAQAEEALRMKVAHCIPSEPTVILPAINKGVPVVLHHPSAKVSQSLRQLAASCNGHHGKKKS